MEPNNAMMCGHTNEVPNKCQCPNQCYCKFNTCSRRQNDNGLKKVFQSEGLIDGPNKPKWCKCEGHEHEANPNIGNTCSYHHQKPILMMCGCKPPTKKMRFSEIYCRAMIKWSTANPDASDPLSMVALFDKFAETLDHFLPEIEVPNETK